jgi:hypothetical protein
VTEKVQVQISDVSHVKPLSKDCMIVSPEKFLNTPFFFFFCLANLRLLDLEDEGGMIIR